MRLCCASFILAIFLSFSPEFGDTKRRDLDGGRLEGNVQATAGGLGAGDRTLGLPVPARLIVGATGSLQSLESAYRPVVVGTAEDYLAAEPGPDAEASGDGSRRGLALYAEAAGGHHGGGTPYKVPDDNPFAEIPGVMGEVWAYGLRNPWRFSFDMAGDNELISADVGQNLYDEISVIRKGGNYGWNVWEGRHCFNAASPTEPYETCPTETGAGHPVVGDPLLMPVIETKNAGYFEDGAVVAVVGGYVYRGPTLPRLFGEYLFGVYSRSMEGGHQPGRIFVATREGDDWPFEELRITNRPDGGLDHLLLSFGQDRAGEVYVLVTDQAGLEGASGWVYRLVPSP